MPEFINYLAGMPAPDFAGGFTRGLQAGNVMREIQNAQQDRELQLQAQQAAQQRAQQYRVAMAEAFENPTQMTFTKIAAMFPEMSKQVKEVTDIQNIEQQNRQKEQTENKFNHTMEVSNLMEANRPDLAQQRLSTIVDGYKNSNQPVPAVFQTALDAFKSGDTKAAQAHINLAASVIDPERFKNTVNARVNYATAPEQVKAVGLGNQNIQSQIAERAGRLQLDIDRLGLDREKAEAEASEKAAAIQSKDLPEYLNKKVMELSENAVISSNMAERMEQMASKFEQEAKDQGKGAWSRFGEWAARETGRQDEISTLRDEATRLTNSNVIKMMAGLKGASSDNDLKTFFAGHPKADADEKYVARYFRGMAKAQRFEAANADLQSQWLQEARTTGSVKRDIEIDGVTVPAGTTYQEFAAKYLPKKIENLGTQQQATVKNNALQSVLNKYQNRK